MSEIFIVKMIEKKQPDRYALTVSRNGQIQSSTLNKSRATRLTGMQVNAIVNYMQSAESKNRKKPYKVEIDE